MGADQTRNDHRPKVYGPGSRDAFGNILDDEMGLSDEDDVNLDDTSMPPSLSPSRKHHLPEEQPLSSHPVTILVGGLGVASICELSGKGVRKKSRIPKALHSVSFYGSKLLQDEGRNGSRIIGALSTDNWISFFCCESQSHDWPGRWWLEGKDVCEGIGHSAPVFKMARFETATTPSAVDSSSSFLVSGSNDNTACLWNVGSIERMLEGEEEEDGGKAICVAKTRADSQIYSKIRFVRSPTSGDVGSVYFGTGRGVVHQWKISEKMCSDQLSRLIPTTYSHLASDSLVGKVSTQIQGIAVDDENELVYAASAWDLPEMSVFSSASLQRVTTFRPGVQNVRDIVFHKLSKSILIHDNEKVHVFDVRKLTDDAVRRFPVQNASSCWTTETVQVGESSFVSTNGSPEVSVWTLTGKVLALETFDSDAFTVSSSFDLDGEVAWRSHLAEEEWDRIEFLRGGAVGQLLDRVVVISVGDDESRRELGVFHSFLLI